MNTVKKILNSQGEVDFVPLTRREQVEAATAWNAQGDVDTTSAGYKYAIDTLTFIISRITTQKFYEVTPSDFIPVEVGNGGWTDNIVTNIEFSAADDFETGVIDTGNSEARMASVEAGVSPKSLAVTMWGKKIGYNIAEIQQALMRNRWDAIEAKERARKKNYDLGIQSIAFLGSKVDAIRTPGLLTNADVNIDTTTISKPIKEMTDAEFQTLVANLLSAYFENANATVLPDTFVIPMSDYLGLAAATNTNFNIRTKLSYLTEMFQSMCGAGFEIKPLAYADAIRNQVVGVNKQQYLLYRRDPSTIRMDVTLPYTVLAPGTADNFTFNSVAYSRYTGVGIYRPLEVLKFEHDPSS